MKNYKRKSFHKENEGKSRKILQTWKEISNYLDRNVRTCQRWEKKLNLPVYRIEESSRPSVFAYQDEIDEWLTNRVKNNEIGKKTFFERKGAVRGTIVVLCLAVVVLSFFFIFKYEDLKAHFELKNFNPTHFVLEDNVAHFYDDNNKSLWNFELNTQRDLNSDYFPSYKGLYELFDFADIDFDLKNEALFFHHNDKLNEREILLFDNDGTVHFRKVFDPDQNYIDSSLDYLGWVVTFLMFADVVEDKTPEILATWKNQDRFPSAFVIYDIKGKELCRYNHSGHLHMFKLYEKQDGRKYVYIGGTNNLLDGDATLAILDCSNLRNGTFPPYDVPEDLMEYSEKLKKYVPVNPVRSTQEYFIRICHNGVTRLKNSYSTAFIESIDKNGLKIRIPPVINEYRLDYYLDHSFRLMKIIPNLGFERIWNEFYLEKIVGIPLTEFIKQAEKNILFWDGERFVDFLNEDKN